MRLQGSFLYSQTWRIVLNWKMDQGGPPQARPLVFFPLHCPLYHPVPPCDWSGELLKGRPEGGFALCIPHPTDSREEAKLVKQSKVHSCHCSQQRTFHLSSFLQVAGLAALPAFLWVWSLGLSGPSCPHPMLELDIKEAREQSG